MKDHNSRNVGLDLLRFLSMLGIIGLHIINAGGSRGSLSNVIDKGMVSWMETIMLSSVNVFAMITGYLYVSRKVRSRNIVQLIATCIFYWMAVTAVLAVCFPGLLHSPEMWLTSLFPPQSGAYWYMVCYIFMFFVAPFINDFLQSLTQKRFRTLVILLFILLSLIPCLLSKDYFAINSGYSPWWLITCYIIGAYVRLHGIAIKRKTAAVFFGAALPFGVMLFQIVVKRLTGVNILLSRYSYTSPFILIESVLFLSVFSEIAIPASLCSTVSKLSSYAFGVYILHCHPIIYDELIVDRFTFIGDWKAGSCAFGIILWCVVIYLLCIPIDSIRMSLFRSKIVSACLDKIGEKMDRWLYS